MITICNGVSCTAGLNFAATDGILTVFDDNLTAGISFCRSQRIAAAGKNHNPMVGREMQNIAIFDAAGTSKASTITRSRLSKDILCEIGSVGTTSLRTVARQLWSLTGLPRNPILPAGIADKRINFLSVIGFFFFYRYLGGRICFCCSSRRFCCPIIVKRPSFVPKCIFF